MSLSIALESGCVGPRTLFGPKSHEKRSPDLSRSKRVKGPTSENRHVCCVEVPTSSESLSYSNHGPLLESSGYDEGMSDNSTGVPELLSILCMGKLG